MTNIPDYKHPILLTFEATMRGENLPLLNKGTVADSVPELPRKIYGEGKAKLAEPYRKLYGHGSPKPVLVDAMNFVVHLEGPGFSPKANGFFAGLYKNIVTKHFASAGFGVLKAEPKLTDKGMDLEVMVALSPVGLERAAYDPKHPGVEMNKRLIESGRALAASILPAQYPA